MAKDFIQRIVRENSLLTSWVEEFNFRPARYVHPSFWKRWGGEAAVHEALQTRRGAAGLSRLVLREAQAEGDFFLDFESEPLRLALLPGEALGRLIRLAGLAANSHAIRQAIRKDDVALMRRQLGEDDYSFGVKVAPFLGNRGDLDFSRDESDGKDMAVRVRRSGRRCVEAAGSGAPPALTKRWNLRFAPDERLDFSPRWTADQKEQAWRLLKRILLRYMEPEWAACFS